MPDNLYLGLDNTQPNVLRVVYLVTKRPFSTTVLKWERCRDLEQFQQLVTRFIPSVVATSPVRHDPFGALSWLADQRTPIRCYQTHELLAPFDEENLWEFSKIYRRAYSLAFQAAYDFEAPRALEDLWRELHWTKESLERLERDFNRLLGNSQAVPV